MAPRKHRRRGTTKPDKSACKPRPAAGTSPGRARWSYTETVSCLARIVRCRLQVFVGRFLCAACGPQSVVTLARIVNASAFRGSRGALHFGVVCRRSGCPVSAQPSQRGRRRRWLRAIVPVSRGHRVLRCRVHLCWIHPDFELFVVAQRPSRHHQRWARRRGRQTCPHRRQLAAAERIQPGPHIFTQPLPAVISHPSRHIGPAGRGGESDRHRVARTLAVCGTSTAAWRCRRTPHIGISRTPMRHQRPQVPGPGSHANGRTAADRPATPNSPGTRRRG